MPLSDRINRDFRRILLIKLSAIGDVVHTLPVLNKLRHRYPAARIDWLVKPGIAEFLRGNPAISNVIEFADGVGSALRLVARLRAAEYDLVLDLQGQARSAVFAFLSGAPLRIGFDRPRPDRWSTLSRTIPDEAKKHAWQGAREGSFLAYTHHIALPTLDRHPVERYLAVAPMLGLDDGPPDFSFPIPPRATARAGTVLEAHRIADATFVAIAPGTNWDTKQWRAEGFAEVARHFLRQGFAVVLIGSPNERALCESIARAAAGAVNLAGATSLPELAALLRRAALCVSNDSGPMHLAVALGRPVVSVFGPTDPVWAGPYQRGNAVLRADVVRADLPCSPCYLRRLSECPNGHACMVEVSAAAVIQKAADLLAIQSAPS